MVCHHVPQHSLASYAAGNRRRLSFVKDIPQDPLHLDHLAAQVLNDSALLPGLMLLYQLPLCRLSQCKLDVNQVLQLMD